MQAITLRLGYIGEYFIKLPLLQAGVGVCLGIVIGMNTGLQVKTIEIFCITSLIILLLFIIVTKSTLCIALAVICSTFLVSYFRFQNAYGQEVRAEVQNNFGREISTLELISDGQKEGENKIFTAKCNGIPGNIQLKLPRDADAAYGDEIVGHFELKEPKNPDEFDYKFYLATQGIFYTANSSSFKIAGRKSSLLSYFSRARVVASSRIRMTFPEPHASLIAGLLWGERANMPEKFKNNLARTGTTHIIAVSGFNVSMVVLIMLKLAGTIPRKSAVCVTILGLISFLVLVGLNNTPAMRAGIMGFIVLISKSFGRKISFLSVLAVPVIILLIMNPLTLYTVSFQLSFSAMVGIIVFSKPLMYHLYIMPSSIREEAATTIAAIIATSPVTIVNFNSFSIVALLVNMLVLPTITIISLLGFIGLFFSLISIELGRIFSFITIPVMNYMIDVINYFGALSFASVTLPKMSQNLMPILYCIMALLAIEIAFRKQSAFRI